MSAVRSVTARGLGTVNEIPYFGVLQGPPQGTRPRSLLNPKIGGSYWDLTSPWLFPVYAGAGLLAYGIAKKQTKTAVGGGLLAAVSMLVISKVPSG